MFILRADSFLNVTNGPLAGELNLPEMWDEMHSHFLADLLSSQIVIEIYLRRLPP